jgi:single-stranded DNA-binding protein
MLSVLIAGTVRSTPETKTSAAGKPYTRFRVAVPLEGADPILASVVAFGDAATSAAVLTTGDSCSIAGNAKPTTWTGKDGETKVGLDIIATAILTAYQAKKRRRAGSMNDGDRHGR